MCIIYFLTGAECLETPPAPTGMKLINNAFGIAVNATAEYVCLNGAKFLGDFEQASLIATCLVQDTWDPSEIVDSCVESKISFS